MQGIHPLTRRAQCPLGRNGPGGWGTGHPQADHICLAPTNLLSGHTHTKPVSELILYFQKSCKNGSTPCTLHPASSNVTTSSTPSPHSHQNQDVRGHLCYPAQPSSDFSVLPACAPPTPQGPRCSTASLPRPTVSGGLRGAGQFLHWGLSAHPHAWSEAGLVRIPTGAREVRPLRGQVRGRAPGASM